MNRQKVILLALLVIFAISLTYSLTHQPPQKTVSTLKYTPGATVVASRQVDGLRDDKKLHLELLDRELPRFSGFRRNIFQPIFRDETKAPPITASAKTTLPIPPPPAPLPPPTPPPPVPRPDPAQAEMARFTFLGFLQKDNRKTVFLSRDKEIVLARKGDKIAGKYEVANITDEALTINLPAGGQFVIPLVENKPLRGR